LRTADDLVDIIGGSGQEIPEGDGRVAVGIPLREEISRGEHRLEAALDNGVRWAANVIVPSLPPTPILLLDQSAAHIGAVVNFRVQHFPQDTELQVTFWQGNSGCGVFTGMLGATGELSGFFKIPPIVNNFTQPGWHNLEASTSGRRATARTQISVTPLPEDQVVELAGSTITSSNAQASVSLSTIRVQPARLSLAISILSHVRDYPLRLHSISAQISAEHGDYHLVTEPFADVQGQILQPDSAYQAMQISWLVSVCLQATHLKCQDWPSRRFWGSASTSLVSKFFEI
jgi:hypothetical protein